ncbi:MAG: hypothetical protein KatS3mg068_2385 [Candidatus Sericytochromatia bacterium]|nr:MAG: hypothetical protein KatS3mg068_2385 [Candidatus Sericytochromatia bacterium]
MSNENYSKNKVTDILSPQEKSSIFSIREGSIIEFKEKKKL